MIETEISARLRRAAQALRTTSMPLADLIPLLQAAADEADRFHDGMVAWKKTAEAKDAQMVAPAAPAQPKCQYCQDSREMMMGDCKMMPCDQCQARAIPTIRPGWIGLSKVRGLSAETTRGAAFA